MLVSTWNVNGLRSASSSGFCDWLERTRPDILCLQETKMEPDMLTDRWFDGYELNIFPAQKSGYAGTGLLIRNGFGPRQLEFGMGNDEFDKEGRVVSAEFETFWVVNIYAPHSHRELKNLDKKARFAAALIDFLQDRMARPDGKPVILAGDFNVAFQERDVFHFANNRGNAGFHEIERNWFNDLLNLGFVDALREITSEGGIYSWWSLLPGVREKNVGWRLDYILVDERLKGAIQHCIHSTTASGSDHCPVSVSIELEALSC